MHPHSSNRAAASKIRPNRATSFTTQPWTPSSPSFVVLDPLDRSRCGGGTATGVRSSLRSGASGTGAPCPGFQYQGSLSLRRPFTSPELTIMRSWKNPSRCISCSSRQRTRCSHSSSGSAARRWRAKLSRDDNTARVERMSGYEGRYREAGGYTIAIETFQARRFTSVLPGLAG